MKNNLSCYLFVVLSLIIPIESFANKIAVQGENISSDKFNSSVFQIGDIKQALLSQNEFQSLNGDCWVMMAGQSISGSDYANLTSRTILPNASGRFLRNFGSETVAVGDTQEDAFQGHGHRITTAGGVSGMTGLTGSSYNVGGGSNIDAMAGIAVPQGANGTPRTSTETRPKNLVVNTFIKINKQCNFN